MRAPHSRTARSTITSNTGCTSDGDEAMTLRMSAVAVCRSSASWVSLNSRVLDGDHGLVGKGLQQATCFAEGAGLGPAHGERPMASPARNIGTVTWLRVPRASII